MPRLASSLAYVHNMVSGSSGGDSGAARAFAYRVSRPIALHGLSTACACLLHAHMLRTRARSRLFRVSACMHAGRPAHVPAAGTHLWHSAVHAQHGQALLQVQEMDCVRQCVSLPLHALDCATRARARAMWLTHCCPCLLAAAQPQARQLPRQRGVPAPQRAPAVPRRACWPVRCDGQSHGLGHGLLPRASAGLALCLPTVARWSARRVCSFAACKRGALLCGFVRLHWAGCKVGWNSRTVAEAANPLCCTAFVSLRLPRRQQP